MYFDARLEFLFRSIIAIFIGYFLSYNFASSLPYLLNLSYLNQPLFANLFLMIFFVFWSLISYVLNLKLLVLFCVILSFLVIIL
ncbi:hypothetical protein F1B92_06620 [Campylobacter sp. FMV-PI01]|uniref:Uncharacterized protein n=1 Tax=Campylobacter portucalensis TaxID=2608384 RepID=A0A6L5WKR2_9BACT|nr:hypothetical protein [Campylobacter portucalensis]MSN96837.1 hypothetical protein [Campylobacter portucalensis]